MTTPNNTLIINRNRVSAEAFVDFLRAAGINAKLDDCHGIPERDSEIKARRMARVEDFVAGDVGLDEPSDRRVIERVFPGFYAAEVAFLIEKQAKTDETLVKANIELVDGMRLLPWIGERRCTLKQSGSEWLIVEKGETLFRGDATAVTAAINHVDYCYDNPEGFDIPKVCHYRAPRRAKVLSIEFSYKADRDKGLQAVAEAPAEEHSLPSLGM